MAHLALLLILGATHAAVDTCATLHSELTRLGCEHDHALPLAGRAADGTIVHLRCTEGYDSCSRTHTPANTSHTHASLLQRGPLGSFAPTISPVTAIASATAADDARAAPVEK